MDEEKNETSEEVTEETGVENSEETNEETVEETKEDMVHYEEHDEIFDLLRNINEQLLAFDEKLDNTISMLIDSGAMTREVDEPKNKKEYEDDFINIDSLDLSL